MAPSRNTLFGTLLSMLAGCGAAPVPPPPPAPPAPPARSMPLKDAGIDESMMDRSADACQDFYRFTCGKLVETAVIPPDRATWGPGNVLHDRTLAHLRATLEKAAAEPGDDPVKKKLGAWWAACMDEPAIEKAGTKPLDPMMTAIAKVKDARSLHQAIGTLHAQGIPALFSIDSQQDFKDATRMIAGLDQAGIGLPDRDYYFDEDASTKEIRAHYRGHVERMFGLLGQKPAEAKKAADTVLRIETAIAKLHQDKVVRRDPYKVYNRVDRAGLAKAAKGFPWDPYFATLGFPAIADVSVNSVEYFTGIDALMNAEKPEAWRTYLTWLVVSSLAPRLSKAFVDEQFAMRSKLTGQKELEPRWRRCVKSTDVALGELLAQEFVKEKFDAESKRLAEELMKAVRGAMRAELGTLAWMDATTRAAAEDKLARMGEKIGYPATWRSYDFEVSAGAYLGNELASERFELARSLRKIGRPVDRSEWFITPPTIDAYYDASMNEMVFPAGILQPPYFDKGFATAVNYGATGGVMGHELTHGFDDQGSQFDGVGNLRKWWTEATGKRFDDQTHCVVEQYARYEAVPGVHLNGELTAGENIADIGGLKIAYLAFREAQKATKERVTAGGFGEDQLFFLAYGQSWCEKARPEYLELRAKTDEHSPPQYRVNGAVADVPQFAAAFGCKAGAPMRPEKACSVW